MMRVNSFYYSLLQVGQRFKNKMKMMRIEVDVSQSNGIRLAGAKMRVTSMDAVKLDEMNLDAPIVLVINVDKCERIRNCYSFAHHFFADFSHPHLFVRHSLSHDLLTPSIWSLIAHSTFNSFIARSLTTPLLVIWPFAHSLGLGRSPLIRLSFAMSEYSLIDR